ncbi:hypothetical protein Rhow_005242 [Rhodococcus wratislaviensis]|uniref:Uncharacterized protein n=1 Tax=Rhodococcus wratislaviensis TaxID=44752 RepID=A0A402CDB2_RHOWR|nr:hypothetical protein [Rhodococcus wratislaviensis]GCE41583.1 hypothetical protein Rhow_005242 [Rhodococcus wratislaviensis]
MSSPSANLPSAPLYSSDDYPLHQTADTHVRVASDNPRWTERWYFNLQREDGALVGIVGGGFYPHGGVLEVYACILHDGKQLNLRQRVIEFDRSRIDSAAAVTFAIAEPMARWSMRAQGSSFDLDLTYRSAQPAYLFPPFVVAADLPHAASQLQVDTVQHFVQPGQIEGQLRIGGEDIPLALSSFRDRTWGVRSSRPRLHQWYVMHLNDGSQLNLIHQERADGAVMVTHIARMWNGGSVETGVLDSHDLEFDPTSRTLKRATFEGHLAGGGAIAISVTNIGDGVRLLGAGYSEKQGEATGLGVPQEEVWDLTDSNLVASLGRGTIDSPATAHCSWGSDTLTGFGITETAIARNHWRYGAQLH